MDHTVNCFIETTAQNYTKTASTIRVLTFKILHGATTKEDFDLDKIADIIKQTNPDLVALQEVDFKTKVIYNSIASDHCAHRAVLQLTE